MAITSVASSTTQSRLWSRRGSAQMPHRGPSEMKAQTSQKATPSLSWARARERRSTDALGVRRRWKARRWALLGPTPGSRSSSSMSAVRAGGRNSTPGLDQAWRESHSRGQLPQLAGGQLAGAIQGFVHGSEDEVLQQLDVLG